MNNHPNNSSSSTTKRRAAGIDSAGDSSMRKSNHSRKLRSKNLSSNSRRMMLGSHSPLRKQNPLRSLL